MKHYSERVASRIADRMREVGATQASVCEATGMHRSTLWRKLHGRRAFDLDEIQRIAAALGVGPEHLAGEDAA
jgi:transcriptional regulator with XRE-family HTH domain